MLRHLGMTRGEIRTMLAVEGALVSGVGLVVGLVLGGAISLILIHVVNRQSFHWSMDLAVPWAPLAGFVAVVLALSVLTSVLAGRRATAATRCGRCGRTGEHGNRTAEDFVKRRAFLALPTLALGPASVVAAPSPYAQPSPATVLRFPRDHGAHPEFRTEWWYLTGRLAARDGRDFGFQVTFFRSRTRVAEQSESRFAPRQIVLAHAALADPRAARLLHDQRAARACSISRAPMAPTPGCGSAIGSSCATASTTSPRSARRDSAWT